MYDGYTARNDVNEIVDKFPTDRNPDSIRLKFGNHVWEDTNGKRGLRGSNKWVKRAWVQYRKQAVLYNDQRINALRAQERDLQDQLDYVRTRIKSHETRIRDVLTLPN